MMNKEIAKYRLNRSSINDHFKRPVKRVLYFFSLDYDHNKDTYMEKYTMTASDDSILSQHKASITELRKNPMAIVNSGLGEPVAILNRGKVAFYCLTPEAYDKLLDLVDDLQMIKFTKSIENEPTETVTIDELEKSISRT